MDNMKNDKLNSDKIWTIWKKIVKRYGNYKGKISWIATYFSSIFSISFHDSTCLSSIFSISFHNFLLYFHYLFTIFFHIFPIFSLFNLSFFHIKIWKKGKLNSEMIWKIWKKCKLKYEMIWKIWRKGKSNSD
jgi:hypothetical protein